MSLERILFRRQVFGTGARHHLEAEIELHQHVVLALDDSINPKTGKKIFACQRAFDRLGKDNQSAPATTCLHCLLVIKTNPVPLQEF